MGKRKISRRRFLEGTGTVLTIAAAAPALRAQPRPPAPLPRTAIRLILNGSPRTIDVEDRWSLAEALRDHLGLTGTKIGCDRGECGVLMDGKPVYSCSQLAVWMDGRSIQTVEGLLKNGQLSPLQQAFVAHDAPQCGFCTSGQLMSATALIAKHPHPSRDEVRAAMAGNICRCSGYNHYVDAVEKGTGLLSAAATVIAAHASETIGKGGRESFSSVGHATPRIDGIA